MKSNKIMAMVLLVCMLMGLAMANAAAAPVKDTVVLTQAEEPTAMITIDIAVPSNQNKDAIVFHQIYDTLYIQENDGTLTPRLATGYTATEDGLEYIITIRDDVYFHNGNKMTAEDVAFVFNEYRDKYQSGYESDLLTLETIEPIDDYTVRFSFSKPIPNFLHFITGYRNGIIDKKYYEEVGGALGYNEAPIGTGAYKFESRVSGESITLVANENYWDGEPAIKKVIIKPIGNISTQFLSLENGEVDFIGRADLASCLQITNPNLTWAFTNSAGRSIMQLTAREPSPLIDDNLRKAIQCALDKEEIVLGVLEGYGMPLDSEYVPTYTGAPDISQLTVIPHDLEKAKEYLAASTYSGQTIVLQCMVGTPEERAAQIIQGQLMAIGINVEITAVDSGTAMARRRTMEGLDMAISAHNAPHRDMLILGTMYKKSDLYTPFYPLELLEKTNSILIEAQTEMDAEKRKGMYAEVANIIVENAFVIPLYNPPVTIAYNVGLKGIEPDYVGSVYVREWSW